MEVNGLEAVPTGRAGPRAKGGSNHVTVQDRKRASAALSQTEKNQVDSDRGLVRPGRARGGGAAGWTLGVILLDLAGPFLAVALPALFRIRHVSIRFHTTLDPSAEQQERDQHSRADTNHVFSLLARLYAAFTLLHNDGRWEAPHSGRIRGQRVLIQIRQPPTGWGRQSALQNNR